MNFGLIGNHERACAFRAVLGARAPFPPSLPPNAPAPAPALALALPPACLRASGRVQMDLPRFMLILRAHARSAAELFMS